jgi:RNA polymerase sigma-70 factor, ECF subfamily
MVWSMVNPYRLDVDDVHVVPSIGWFVASRVDCGVGMRVAGVRTTGCIELARLILRSDDRAEDAVQESLVAAWLHIRAVRDPDRFDAWLHRPLVRACYREARRVKQRAVVEIHIDAPDGPGNGDAQSQTANRDQLERGFRRLTPEQRAVLVVHHYLGLPDAEAAVVLDIAVGTFKSRLNRASAAVRGALEADERTPTAVVETCGSSTSTAFA